MTTSSRENFEAQVGHIGPLRSLEILVDTGCLKSNYLCREVDEVQKNASDLGLNTLIYDAAFNVVGLSPSFYSILALHAHSSVWHTST